ncbi:alkaline phosphatase family protein [Cognataquiflexum rubidum]|uniref:alkaline phosphatase family protein n=1 Tax=Cognataquiflexum rubidum TaxID=2922273 RepID=UPI001F131F98|nr:alkaline phosphatase family protein [Cognataquiflexum rubidum]MCH6235134.1 alkaline phosphatase family protein [Cognataquiflexum rubidum]
MALNCSYFPAGYARRILSLCMVIFLMVATISCNEKTDLKSRKVVLVILDGIPASVIEKVSTPNLDSITSYGGYARAWLGGEKGGYSETPTISAVGYNSMLTGTWVNKHNVKDNNIQFPNYHYWSIFRHFKETYPQKTIAIYSTWLDNRTKLLGEGLPETSNLKLDYHFDGLELDTVRFPHDTLSQYIHEIDKLVASKAAEEISTKAPDLTWVYLQYTDDMGHRYGNSPEMDAAVQEADRQLGEIWKAIKEREKNNEEEYLLIVTTDHGRAAGGFHHGGQSDAEREIWIASNSKFNKRFDHNPAIVDVFPTVANYLGIKIPIDHAMELDGVSLLGEVSATDLSGKIGDGKLRINWKNFGEKQVGKAWITFGNQFRYGNKDAYILLGEVNLEDESAEFDISNHAFQNAKVVLETPTGFLNYWVKNADQ